MSLKLHFMDSHIYFFPENMCYVSDEHGQQFHQEISEIESRYKGKPFTFIVCRLLLDLSVSFKVLSKKIQCDETFLRLYRQDNFTYVLVTLYITRTYSTQVKVPSSKDYLCKL